MNTIDWYCNKTKQNKPSSSSSTWPPLQQEPGIPNMSFTNFIVNIIIIINSIMIMIMIPMDPTILLPKNDSSMTWPTLNPIVPCPTMIVTDMIRRTRRTWPIMPWAFWVWPASCWSWLEAIDPMPVGDNSVPPKAGPILACSCTLRWRVWAIALPVSDINTEPWRRMPFGTPPSACTLVSWCRPIFVLSLWAFPPLRKMWRGNGCSWWATLCYWWPWSSPNPWLDWVSYWWYPICTWGFPIVVWATPRNDIWLPMPSNVWRVSSWYRDCWYKSSWDLFVGVEDIRIVFEIVRIHWVWTLITMPCFMSWRP